MEIIARIHTDFSSKFGIPRQSGLVQELKGKIIFEKSIAARRRFQVCDGKLIVREIEK